MKARKIDENIHWVGAIDWDRRVFDSLLPLPEGTTYNAYLVRGTSATALIDTVDPEFTDVLFERLADLGIDKLDYIISNHAEQDHSGSLPALVERFPGVTIVTTPKGKDMLSDLMPLDDASFKVVEDGEALSLGDLTFRFIHFPWVHWPETMLTYLEERRTLFSCDLFGCHLATNELHSCDCERARLAAKQYYAQIMMPFRKVIAKNLPKLDELEIDLIAPSHGPLIDQPKDMIERHRRWVSDDVDNLVVLPYISMHDSTRQMVDHFVDALTDYDIRVERFDVESVDIGRLAMTLVDAATIVIGTPTVAAGPHPKIVYATYLANLLRPKAKYASIIGSYGWGGKTVETIVGSLGNLKVELLDPVLNKGRPNKETNAALDRLAASIAERHGALTCES